MTGEPGPRRPDRAIPGAEPRVDSRPRPVVQPHEHDKTGGDRMEHVAPTPRLAARRESRPALLLAALDAARAAHQAERAAAHTLDEARHARAHAFAACLALGLRPTEVGQAVDHRDPLHRKTVLQVAALAERSST